MATVNPAVIPLGERALRISLPDIDAVLALYDAWRHAPLPGQLDLVPGAESLVVQFAGPASIDMAREVGTRASAELARRAVAGQGRFPGGDAPSDTLQIDSVYQGEDLAHVAELLGLSINGVIAAHTGALWRVAFSGFAPGFAYLSGGDPALAVPRREDPRPEVPSGAVGLAGEYSGVYPRPSPGGWQLIGRTDAVLWDARRDPPALLRPGMSVTFRAVRPSMTLQQARPSVARNAKAVDAPRGAARSLVVLRPGLHCVVQDLGRAGFADMGVSPSGAADRTALLRANRAVGNSPGAAALEVLLGGTEFEARADLVVGLAGAPVEVFVSAAASDDAAPSGDAVPAAAAAQPGTASSQHVSRPMERPLALPAGSRVRLGRPARGLRTYLAVRGGIHVPPVLGSRSTDLLADVGPAPVQAGDVLPVGPAEPVTVSESGVGASNDGGQASRGGAPPVAVGDVPGTGGAGERSEAGDGAVALPILPGPQRDWFTDAAWGLLETASWAVTPATNRVAARLSGPPLPRAVTAELPSQGLVRGAIQVPPSGELVAFLADYPVTGGYPVIAVLTDAAADRLAQCRPGTTVRFRDAVSPAP